MTGTRAGGGWGCRVRVAVGRAPRSAVSVMVVGSDTGIGVRRDEVWCKCVMVWSLVCCRRTDIQTAWAGAGDGRQGLSAAHETVYVAILS